MALEGPRLYVGNLPYNAQREDIEKLFAENNIEIKKVDISIDSFSGRNPSYCFVEFSSQEDADTAMNSLQGIDLQGRPLRINPKTERRSAQNNDRFANKTYDRGWRSNDAAPPAPNDRYGANNRWNRNDTQNLSAEEQKRIYVGGLARTADQESLTAEMQALFEGYNVSSVSKLITPSASRPDDADAQFFCFVDVATAEEAVDAVRTLNGRPTPQGGMYRISHAKGKRVTAPAPAVAAEPVAPTSKVFISGLPAIASQDELDHHIRELFAGLDITEVSKLITPHESKQIESGNHHYCFAVFARFEEAQRAVEAMNGQPTPNGGVYKISFARERPAGAYGQSDRFQSRENGYRGGFQQREGQDSPRRQQREQGPPVNRDFGSSWRRRE
ncbi:Putative RNA recognition motif domain, nucleotide-binding alpha-beta plait domain superfamily [Septoria linicola]|uniref:RNA recognition motif domain, nucleotide-binding alpha-beta plait domain superfamily n=1 Tax=Septoria linicola TaxID=215465 RepID=A0A9Q9ATS1_9PEZI|nr:putative RNA recognition motif domain, nucleotide-binding alpha-beta plait domain superfamily [Septoria linicola]USW54594.1 Putative RNA recognition motif domain, nucleotide-binding alpha-beta plait domain superfamily [Septoria linicola]